MMTKVKDHKTKENADDQPVAEETLNQVGDAEGADEKVEVQVESEDQPAASGPDTKHEEVDWQDRYLRLAAEFDNFRKRSAREFTAVIENAERDLIGELTEVLDNLDRALRTDHKGETADHFAKGIELIRDQLLKALESRGLKKMDTVGQPFNPDSHEALMRAPSDDHDEGVIVQEVSPGYRLKDTVIRHARVIVSQGKSESEEK